MKIRIEIETTESFPDIASLLSGVIKRVVEKHGTGDDVRVSVDDDTLLDRIETAQIGLEAADKHGTTVIHRGNYHWRRRKL